MKSVVKSNSLVTSLKLIALLLSVVACWFGAMPSPVFGQDQVVYGNMDDPNFEPGRDWLPWGGIQNGWAPNANVYLIGHIILLDSAVVVNSGEYTVYFGDPALAPDFGGCDLSIPNGYSLTIGKVEIPDGGLGYIEVQNGGSFTCSTLKIDQLFTQGQPPVAQPTFNVTNGASITANGLVTIQQGQLYLNGSADIDALTLSDADGSLKINSAGASISITNGFSIESGALELLVGTISCGSVIQYHPGSQTISGGTFNCNGGYTDYGSTAVSGGNFTVSGDAEIGCGVGGAASFSITGAGNVTFEGDLNVTIGTGAVEPDFSVNLNNSGNYVNASADVNVSGGSFELTSGVLGMTGALTLGVCGQNTDAGTFTVSHAGTVSFENSANHSDFDVLNGSTLTVTGTANDPAAIKAANGLAGGWGELLIANSSSADISYAAIYGGGSSATVARMIRVTDDGGLTLSHSEIYNSQTGGILLATSTSPEISTSSLHNVVVSGIKVTGADVCKIHNNFIYSVSQDWQANYGYGIECGDNLSDIRVYNNFLFNTGGNLIRLEDSSGTDIVYNTLVYTGGSTSSAIYINGTGGTNRIYNNIFWGYDTNNGHGGVQCASRTQGADDAIDGNVFQDSKAAQAYRNVEPPDDQPDEPYSAETFSQDPYDDGIKIPTPPNDYTDFRFVQATGSPYDFHVYGWNAQNVAPDLRNAIPKFVNRGINPAGEWWHGNDPDGSAPDAGAYGGPNSAGFVEVPISNNTYFVSVPGDANANGYNDPYVAIHGEDGMRWPPTWNDAWSPVPMEYYVTLQNVQLPADKNIQITAGATVKFGSNHSLAVGGGLKALGTNALPVTFTSPATAHWAGITFQTSASPNNAFVNHCVVARADNGFSYSGLNYTNPFTIDSTIITDCGTGIYINNSKVTISHTTISDCTPNTSSCGIFMSNCGMGLVKLDSDTITGNGHDGTIYSAGLYLSSSSPEIIRTVIEHNSGSGIYSWGSAADLNTYDWGTYQDRPNTIRWNGGATQSGSNGSEVYLGGSSYPDIQYDNIYDYSGGPVGYMIYKDPSTNSYSLSSPNNYWGATPGDNFFYWGGGSPISYSGYSANELDRVSDLDLAVKLWKSGDIRKAMAIFCKCLYSEGPEGIRAVHYLSGCYNELDKPDYKLLRKILLNVAEEQHDKNVAKVAQRFATNCLTMEGKYEDAMDEYDQARLAAKNVADSISAVVDYLSVAELAGGNKVHGMVNIRDLMRSAIGDPARPMRQEAIASDFTLDDAYPNPFNSITTIRYTLPQAANVSIKVLDISGREVTTLFSGNQPAGSHSVIWSGVNASGNTVASGVYFYRIETDKHTQAKKMMLLK